LIVKLRSRISIWHKERDGTDVRKEPQEGKFKRKIAAYGKSRYVHVLYVR